MLASGRRASLRPSQPRAPQFRDTAKQGMVSPRPRPKAAMTGNVLHHSKQPNYGDSCNRQRPHSAWKAAQIALAHQAPRHHFTPGNRSEWQNGRPLSTARQNARNADKDFQRDLQRPIAHQAVSKEHPCDAQTLKSPDTKHVRGSDQAGSLNAGPLKRPHRTRHV